MHHLWSKDLTVFPRIAVRVVEIWLHYAHGVHDEIRQRGDAEHGHVGLPIHDSRHVELLCPL